MAKRGRPKSDVVMLTADDVVAVVRREMNSFINPGLDIGATAYKAPPEISKSLGDAPSNRTLSIVENEAQILMDCARRLDNHNHRLRNLLSQFGVAPPPTPPEVNKISSGDVSLQSARRQVEEKINELSDILSMTI